MLRVWKISLVLTKVGMPEIRNSKNSLWKAILGAMKRLGYILISPALFEG
jgi:hypothetical protein